MNQELKIIQAIAQHLGLAAEDLDRNALLLEDVNLGPIELNDLLSDLSEQFNVSFDAGEIEDLQKVDDLIILVEDKLIE